MKPLPHTCHVELTGTTVGCTGSSEGVPGLAMAPVR
jgi:hypothetical protein